MVFWETAFCSAHFQQNFTYVFKWTNKEIQSYFTYVHLQHSFVGIICGMLTCRNVCRMSMVHSVRSPEYMAVALCGSYYWHRMAVAMYASTVAYVVVL